MILTFDIGNTQISGGVFNGQNMVLQFRYGTSAGASSDELGVFLRSVLRENQLDPKQIKNIAYCSVVPSMNYPALGACIKYFDVEPLVIRAGIKTGLKLRYSNPKEIGADRIAAAIGAVTLVPGIDCIIVDMGTATTIDVITRQNEYRGGAILPGVNMSMHVLASGTAQLPVVEIVGPEKVCGTTTVGAIQSGLYYGTIGAVRELITRFTTESFGGRKPYVIGTGGFSHLFEKVGLFDRLVPNLVLSGLRIALELNT
ncbi:MAG: type III pantothenate kinase [Treponema sp.]|jgi:type III pantothenate kinase|nr:type III pantothenate kinase [Treponema sp.]